MTDENEIKNDETKNDETKNDEIKNDETKKETIQNIIPFWSDNPNILLNNKFMFELFPVEKMSFEQKLNAISRLVVLLTLMSFFYTKGFRILFIGAVSLFFIFMLHKSKTVENNEIKKKKEGFSNSPADPFLKTADLKDVFREPDSTNPFGNVLITDYIYNPKRKPAPPAYNESVAADIVVQAKQMVKNANPGNADLADKLFKDLGDEYVFEQSLQPFYSTASTTIPNDQQSFSEFCYGGMVSCKEGNAFACAKTNAGNYNLY